MNNISTHALNQDIELNDTSQISLAKVYRNLFFTVASFILTLFILFQTGIANVIAIPLASNWLLTLGAFMVGAWLASRLASRVESKTSQLLGLALYIIFQALIFTPLLLVAVNTAGYGILLQATVISLTAFAGLSLYVIKTRQDFSFMRGFLTFIGIVAIIAIIAGIIFQFDLGLLFSVAMVLFAGGAILHDTSNILLNYPKGHEISATLQLFASFVLLLWYVVSILMRLGGE